MRRLLILTAAATLLVTAGASARTKHHHYRDASALVAEDAIAADTLSPHDAYMKNLHDSGYNPHNDRDAHGVMRTN
jgi:hypothetical protein